MKTLKNLLPGLLLTLGIALVAWPFGKLYTIIGGPVFAILMGMMVRPLVQNKILYFKSGIQYSSKKILQFAIILLGFQMNLLAVLKTGQQSLMIMIFTLSAALVTAYVIGKCLKLDTNMTLLIGVGTSICGGSAIAATAPIINASDEEIAHSISTIFLFNIVAVFIFPLIGHLIGLSDYGFGVFTGTAVNDTSSVVATATAWSMTAGNNIALSTATIVKLTRTLMIIPITLFLSVVQMKKHKGGAYSFSKVFPWFVLGFLFATLLNTLFQLDQNLTHQLVQLGKFMIVMAMSAIGLNTDLKRLVTHGLKPIALGLICWISVASVALIVQKIIQLW